MRIHVDEQVAYQNPDEPTMIVSIDPFETGTV